MVKKRPVFLHSLLFVCLFTFGFGSWAQAPATTTFYNDAGVTVLVYDNPGEEKDMKYRKTIIPTGPYQVTTYAGHKFRIIEKATGEVLMDYTTTAYNKRIEIKKKQTAKPSSPTYRVTFTNETNKVVDIFFDYQTKPELKWYKTLNPGDSHAINAYAGNKWRLKDKVSGVEYLTYVTPAINSSISVTGMDVAEATCNFQTSTKPQPLKSKPGSYTLTFSNLTEHTVDIMLVAGESQEYAYQTLKPGDAYEQLAQKGQVWKAEDRSTGAVFLTYVTKEVSETVKIRASNVVANRPKKQVEIKWLNMPSVVNTANVKISAEIYNSDNLDEMVFINDRKVGKDRITKEESHGKLYVEIDAVFSTGENKIEMMVFTNDGEKVVAPIASVKYKKELTSGIVKPNLFFLGIGVSEYEGGNFPSLEYADDDIIALKDKFVAMENSALYGTVKTKLLLNEAATLNNIYEALSQFFNKAASTDYVVLMISSHGEVVNEEFYILPYDCSPDPNHFSFRAISSIDLGKYLKNVQASKMVLLDACHSGAARLDIIEKSADVTERKVNTVLKSIRSEGASSYIFSSSTGNQKSLQLGNVRHGVFTYAMLMGMEGQSYTLKTDGTTAHAGETIAPKAVRGVLMMDALREYVMEVVMDMTNGKQHPSFRKIATDAETGQGLDMPVYLIR